MPGIFYAINKALDFDSFDTTYLFLSLYKINGNKFGK
nr:MAG TPA: hypothetical protein [Caudoviricetes sp.]